MPFGRYRGWPLDELPDNYVAWLRGLDDLREPLRGAITRECQARGFAPPPPAALAPLPPEAVPAAEAIITAGYRLLAQRHHPDRGGSTATMQAINRASAWLRRQVGHAA